MVSSQTREEIRVAFNIADDELQGFINNPATLSNTPDVLGLSLEISLRPNSTTRPWGNGYKGDRLRVRYM